MFPQYCFLIHFLNDPGCFLLHPYTGDVWSFWFIYSNPESHIVAQVGLNLSLPASICQQQYYKRSTAQPASNSSFRAAPSQSGSLLYIRKCNFWLVLSFSPLYTREPVFCMRSWAHSLSRRDTASYIIHSAVSAVSSRPTSSPAMAPSVSFLPLSHSLMNGCTLSPYGCLQLTMLGMVSVFANVAANSSMTKLSRYLLVLISILLSDTFQPLQNSCFQPLILSTNMSLTLSSLFPSLQISAFVSITFCLIACQLVSFVFCLLSFSSYNMCSLEKSQPYWWALRLWAEILSLLVKFSEFIFLLSCLTQWCFSLYVKVHLLKCQPLGSQFSVHMFFCSPRTYYLLPAMSTSVYLSSPK